MPRSRPKTGEARKTRQPLNIDRLPPHVLDVILQLRNGRGKTWDEISALSAEPVGRSSAGFIEWDKLAPEVIKLFPGKRIPRTTLHRWFDIRVEQVRSDVMRRSAQARTIAESFAKSVIENGDEAVVNAARDTIMGILAEDPSEGGRARAAKALIALAEVMQAAKTNALRERKVATDERKMKLLEDREALQRAKLQREADQMAKKHTKGELKREDLERLVERTFGIAPKAA